VVEVLSGWPADTPQSVVAARLMKTVRDRFGWDATQAALDEDGPLVMAEDDLVYL
jgi:hypothetical protein